MTRSEALCQLKAGINSGKMLLGVGVGTVDSAKTAERLGADVIVACNTGRYEAAGRGYLAGLLPYGDANGIVAGLGEKITAAVRDIPVLAGVCGTDPFRIISLFLRQLKKRGFSGIQNFPSVGLIDGVFRQNLEESGMGYELEVDMIRAAREQDLLTIPFVFGPGQAEKMVRNGADVLIAHMGLNTKGRIGAERVPNLDECVERTREISEAGRRINPDVIVFCHGGAVVGMEEAHAIRSGARNVHGFFRMPALSENCEGQSLRAGHTK